MKILKRYATQEQKTIVITVHQPSSQMFHMFDKLLLLYNGTTAYFGEVNNIYRYFEDIGVSIKPHYNPAEFVRKYNIFFILICIYTYILMCLIYTYIQFLTQLCVFWDSRKLIYSLNLQIYI